MNFSKMNTLKDYRKDYSAFIADWKDAVIKSNKLIIVEGKKDRIALIKLGISSNYIRTLNAPLNSIIEMIAAEKKEVIILTDFDAHGRKLYAMLRQGFEYYGVPVDIILREALRKYTRVSHIEGIK